MWPLFLSSSYFAREPRGISTNPSTTSGFAFAGMGPPRVGVRGRDDDGDLALRTLGSIPSGKVLRRAAHEGLVHLRELAGDDDTRVGRDGGEILQEIAGAVRALVDDDGPALSDKRGERLASRPALLRQEAEERERAGRKARRDERGDRGVRSGDGRDGVARGDGRRDERLARIREGGRARVRHEGDVPPAIELPDEDADLALVVELGVRREVLRADLVAPQEDLGVPGVLAGDHVDLLQDLQRARRDVLEVPDRRRDEVERPHPASIAGTFAAMSRAVDEFVKRRVAPELRPVVTLVRRLMRENAPDATEEIKYGIPMWTGTYAFAFLNPTKREITFGFSHGVHLTDRYGLLKGRGKWARHVKLRTVDEANRPALRSYIKQAAKIDAKR